MRRLLVDMGGTNTRCAHIEAGIQPQDVRYYRNADFNHPAEMLADYLQTLQPALRPSAAALAIAAPIRANAVTMLNINWKFSAQRLRDELSLERLEILNDFAALAQAIPVLDPADVKQNGGKIGQAKAPCVVLGPGTGLGVAGLVACQDQYLAIASEGGHVSMAGNNELEAAMIEHARAEYGHCSAERLISGPGLSLIHAYAQGKSGVSAEQIGAQALAGDAGARASLDLMFALLGSFAGNLALSFGATGGVYIGGGIVPKHLEQFLASPFRQRFESKGRHADYLRAIPSYVITLADPALRGLAAWSEHWNEAN